MSSRVSKITRNVYITLSKILCFYGTPYLWLIKQNVFNRNLSSSFHVINMQNYINVINVIWSDKISSAECRSLTAKNKPSVLNVRIVQSMTPVYGLSSRPALIISPWFCTSSFTRSMGAAAVFEIMAAAPLSPKFSANPRWGLGFDSSPIYT